MTLSTDSATTDRSHAVPTRNNRRVKFAKRLLINIHHANVIAHIYSHKTRRLCVCAFSGRAGGLWPPCGSSAGRAESARFSKSQNESEQ